uniref:Uncharacterized protein n=1 Tax=Myripristis murdjan TaxID=586833 RepID=A0A667YPL0_9TELE
MLITMLTAMYVMVKVVETIGARLGRQDDEPLPYVVSQPLPWQVHSVSHSRKNSKADEVSHPMFPVLFTIRRMSSNGERALTVNSSADKLDSACEHLSLVTCLVTAYQERRKNGTTR